VDHNGYVEPADVLTEINYINTYPDAASLPPPPTAEHPYFDVNNDGLCTALDALIVINNINRRTAAAGEGEAPEADWQAVAFEPQAWELLAGVGNSDDLRGGTVGTEFSGFGPDRQSLHRPAFQRPETPDADNHRPATTRERSATTDLWDEGAERFGQLDSLLGGLDDVLDEIACEVASVSHGRSA
jgi:hypothetical protein